MVQQAPGSSVFAGPRDEDLYKCVHCGLCLNACPTYLETGLETESPRGRIALMKAVREDRVSYTKQVTSHMDLCLQCRACEVVCPSGVPFGRLMEATWEEISQQKRAPLWKRFALNLAFHHLLSYPGRLYALGAALRLYQRTGLPRLFGRVPGMPGRFHRQLPSLPGNFFKPPGDVGCPPYQGQGQGRPALRLRYAFDSWPDYGSRRAGACQERLPGSSAPRPGLLRRFEPARWRQAAGTEYGSA